MNEKTLKDIIQTRKILKNKFRAIKMGGESVKKTLEKTFFPVTQPLKQLLKKSEPATIKKVDIKSNESIKKYVKMDTSTPIKKVHSIIKPHDSVTSDDETLLEKDSKTDSDGESVDDYESAAEGDDDDITTNSLNHFERQKVLDTTYGPNKDATGNWRFGNSPIEIDGDKISIGSRRWSVTPGLIQLLFHKTPKGFDETELSIYKSILLETNAYRHNFRADSGIKGTNSNKYRDIIKPLISSLKSAHEGSGLMTFTDKKPNLVYWDDPNELVDRLRLLVSSQAAGHNNHNNEIQSIEEELREAKIIK